MKLVDIKELKKDSIYRRILDEIKVKGLNKVYIKTTDQVDYLDLIVNVIEFIDANKSVLKNLKEEQYENLVVIVIDELLEDIGIDADEDQIEKILKLLKNSLLVNKVTKLLIDKLKDFWKFIKPYLMCNTRPNKSSDSTKSTKKTEIISNSRKTDMETTQQGDK
jgi:hypothetical protein